MLRLLDARSGRRVEVRLGRPHMLRVGAHVSQETGEPGWGGVRVLLMADLLTRVAELQGLQALTAVLFPGEPPAEFGFAERAADLLGVHPPATRASSLQTAVTPGGPVDVHITGSGAPDDRWAGLSPRPGQCAWTVRVQAKATRRRLGAKIRSSFGAR